MQPRRRQLVRHLLLMTLAVGATSCTAGAAVAASHASGWTAWLLYATIPLALGGLATAAGRLLESRAGRWATIAWVIAVVDLLLFGPIVEFQRYDDPGCFFAFALLAGQIAALAVWGAMGPLAWPWRAAGVVAGLSLAVSYSCRAAAHTEGWSLVLVLLTVAVLAVAAIVRARRYAVRDGLAEGSALRAGMIEGRFQFTVGHMLVWAMALVPLLVFLRETEIRLISNWRGFLVAVQLAVGLTIVNWGLFWALLRPRLRLIAVLVACSLAGNVATGLAILFANSRDSQFSEWSLFEPRILEAGRLFGWRISAPAY
jgi:hypothetical protein